MRRLRILVMTTGMVLALLLSTVGVADAASATTDDAPTTPVLREIRAAHHRGFDRLVFEFSGPLPEVTRARWTDAIYADGSGFRVRVAGRAFIGVTMYFARGYDETTFEGTYGPRRRAYALPNLTEVVNSGDWEATLSFGVGVMKRTKIIRRMRLRNPSRYVIDVATNFKRTRVKTWFLNRQRFADNTRPYFRPVWRSVPVPAVANGALHRVYAGPTQAEKARDLRLVRSRTTGFRNLRISRSKIARVQLKGRCDAGGSTVSVAGHIMPTLRQFPTVRWVKIYDRDGTTARPWGRSNSIPECLNP